MKLKTVKTAKKRISNITTNGILLRRRLSAQHLVSGKSKRTRAGAGNQQMVSKADSKKLKKLVPYN